MSNDSQKNVKLYMLMALIGYSIFGFSFLFSKIALNVAEPLVLLTIRFIAAFLLLNIMRFSGLVPCNFKGKNMRSLIILGFLQPVLYFICESYGLKYTSTSFAGIIIALSPIAGLGLSRFFLSERPTKLQVLMSVLSVAGVIVMSAGDDLGTFQMKGLIMLLGAVFCATMFNILSRSIADQFSAFERTYVMFGIAMVSFIVLAAVQVGPKPELWIPPLSNGGFWISIFYLSCISSVMAYMLINKSLNVLEANRSLVFANFTTVLSVLAGVVFLHEHFTLMQVIGSVMVIIGVYGVNRFTAEASAQA